MTQAFIPLGTTLDIGALSFDEVTAINRSGASVPLLDATHMQSTSQEFVAGLADQGELKVSAHLISGQDLKDLETLFQAGITQTVVVALKRKTDHVTIAAIALQGIVNNPEFNADPSSLATMGFTLKITGTPVITPGS